MSLVLVTGAAGFVGSHTCDQLLAAGHSVVGVDNLRTGRRDNIAAAAAQEKFSFVEADICAPGALAAVVSDTRPDAIIHLAALVSVQESVERPDLNFELNLRGTHIVAEAARVHRVARVVFASSAAVYGDSNQLPLAESAEARPISPYGAAKLASESLLLGHGSTYGFVVRCHRYFNVFGPRQDPKSPYSGVISIFCDRLRAGLAPTIFGDGEQTRDFVYVEDVARANVLAALAPAISSGIANICTGRPTSLNELAHVLRRLIPAAKPPVYGAARAGDIRHSLGQQEIARAELGFVATTSLAAGLAALLAHYPPEASRHV